MADNTAIEWADATWNPIVGCKIVSSGCVNCYAMRLAGTRLRHHPSRAGLTINSSAGPVWNGKAQLYEPALDQPLRWRRGRRIFVCAHGDLFYEAVPDEWIDRVFAVMAMCPQHIFLALTKRAERMRQYISDPRLWSRLSDHIPNRRGEPLTVFPMPNVWLGVSVEDQRRADKRIPELLATPAARRFVSAEPLLGPVDLTSISEPNGIKNSLTGKLWISGCGSESSRTIPGERLDWIIVGGESGPGARPMRPDWARSLRAQCVEAGVAFFMKQMNKKEPIPADLFVREFPYA